MYKRRYQEKTIYILILLIVAFVMGVWFEVIESNVALTLALPPVPPFASSVSV